MARDFAKAERLITQMMDYRDEYGLQDFVANFGQYKGANVFDRQPCDHPIHFQHGANGNPLRGMLGIQPRHDGILLTPRIFPDIEQIDFKQPVYYADREIYISIRNGARIKRVTVNGTAIKDFDDETVMLKHEHLSRRQSRVRVEY